MAGLEGAPPLPLMEDLVLRSTRPLSGNLVCRFHGGRAGAPKGTANGSYRTGKFTAEALAERRWLKD